MSGINWMAPFLCGSSILLINNNHTLSLTASNLGYSNHWHLLGIHQSNQQVKNNLIVELRSSRVR